MKCILCVLGVTCVSAYCVCLWSRACHAHCVCLWSRACPCISCACMCMWGLRYLLARSKMCHDSGCLGLTCNGIVDACVCSCVGLRYRYPDPFMNLEVRLMSFVENDFFPSLRSVLPMCFFTAICIVRLSMWPLLPFSHHLSTDVVWMWWSVTHWCARVAMAKQQTKGSNGCNWSIERSAQSHLVIAESFLDMW